MDIESIIEGVRGDEHRNDISLHLTANEAVISNTAKQFMASSLADRYYFGGGDDEGVVDFGPSSYRGLKGVQALIDEATNETKRMLGASVVNLSCLSGVHAMMCAILATTEPGDTVMSVDLAHGGHFSTRPIIERMGRTFIPTRYDFENMEFDTEEMGKAFRSANGKVLYLDVSFYLKPHNLKGIREALGPDAIIIYDASHTLGLIMGNQFQDPFSDGADVLCANTHKTLPGPQKGMIAFKDADLGNRANAIINGGLFSSPHTATTIALAVTILEIARFGEEYASAIITNTNALGTYLEENSFSLRRINDGAFSANHQLHLMTDGLGHYRELYKVFSANNISVNFADTLGGDMFIRLGTQEITRRGMGEPEMRIIADFIGRSLRGDASLAPQIRQFIGRYPNVMYSFDER